MLRTEQRNPRTTHIDKMETSEMLRIIHEENLRSVEAVGEALDSVAQAVDAVANAFQNGGRLIYVGAGTSGRIAVADAAECPPTYGVDYNTVIALIAGGEGALVKASENAEDLGTRGREDLLARGATSRDVVMGISAAGGAEYVASAMRAAKELGCVTISLSSNSPTLTPSSSLRGFSSAVSGKPFPVSQREMALSDTFSLSASPFWVYPFSFRS